MVIPVAATLPDSVLSSAIIARKFDHNSLAGLGSFCDDYPDECGMSDPGGPGGGAPNSIDLCALYSAPGCPGYVAGPQYVNAGGSVGNGTDWTSIITGMVRAGTDVSKLYLIQPGTTQTASGAISRQNPGYAIPGSGVSGVAGGGISTSTLLLIAGAAFVIFTMRKG